MNNLELINFDNNSQQIASLQVEKVGILIYKLEKLFLVDNFR